MMAAEGADMAEKKLRGSGGYAVARVSDEEQKMANLGGPELFLAGIGRLDSDRFVKYFCNRCERDFEGAPALSYENPNEDLGEGVTLAEKGEYKCRACNATIAQYRKFSTPAAAQPQQQQAAPAPTATVETSAAPQPSSLQASAAVTPAATTMTTAATTMDGFVGIQQLVGMAAYDGEAMLVGRVREVGLRRDGGNARITVKISSGAGEEKEVGWDGISKIGDIILLGSPGSGGRPQQAGGKCPSCGYQNEAEAAFCEECGARLAAT
ncbi:zinc-ribbon domain-containing protein [Nitrososphaera sp.]|uniref:zinc ribbon domain-containing protein n=1 Tax=Nitrososphaera sp. TaxID=1971748 RepID=UPI00307D2DF2